MSSTRICIRRGLEDRQRSGSLRLRRISVRGFAGVAQPREVFEAADSAGAECCIREKCQLKLKIPPSGGGLQFWSTCGAGIGDNPGIYRQVEPIDLLMPQKTGQFKEMARINIFDDSIC